MLDATSYRHFVVHVSKGRYDVYVGRISERIPSCSGADGVWGNGYSHKPWARDCIIVPTVEEAVRRHREDLFARPDGLASVRTFLRGKILGCWCAPDLCHGFTYAAIANCPRSEFERLFPEAARMCLV